MKDTHFSNLLRRRRVVFLHVKIIVPVTQFFNSCVDRGCVCGRGRQDVYRGSLIRLDEICYFCDVRF